MIPLSKLTECGKRGHSGERVCPWEWLGRGCGSWRKSREKRALTNIGTMDVEMEI